MVGSSSYTVNSDTELKANFLPGKKKRNVNTNRKIAFQSKAYT